MDDRTERQSAQYGFPYHHIPHFDAQGRPRRSRVVDWGYEYLCYVEHVVRRIAEGSPQSILDVGCGDGYLLTHLGGVVPHRRGVDFDERALGFARAFAPDATFEVRDVASIDELFDVVTAIEVMEHVPDDLEAGFLSACADRVAPGGRLILTIPSVNQPLNPKHFRHYDRAMLEQRLSALSDFSTASIYYYYQVTRFERAYRWIASRMMGSGDIPIVRRWLWSHITDAAGRAGDSNGTHVIAILTRNA